MKTRKVKQSEIILIATLISLLHNSPRILEILGILKGTEYSFINYLSYLDAAFRTVFLFCFSWVVLQYNTNTCQVFNHYSKRARLLINTTVNGIVLYVFTRFYFDLYDNITGNDLYVRDQKLLLFILSLLLFGLIFLALNLRLRIQREIDMEEKDELIKQNLENELAALKNQINPHFLFNSLNSLNSLIRDNQAATTFVNQMSHMYRYILQSSQKDMVTIAEELAFLESYIFLIKTRYRDKFSIEIDLDESLYKKEIPVLVFQLLIENAIKHNEISNRNPLEVKIYNDANHLVIENKIVPRKTFVDSTGKGLININKRYNLVKGKSILILNENNFFKVKLPLN